MAGAQDQQARVTKRAELPKATHERAVGNTREAADPIAKSDVEAPSCASVSAH